MLAICLHVAAASAASAEPRGRVRRSDFQPHVVASQCASSLLSSPSSRACMPALWALHATSVSAPPSTASSPAFPTRRSTAQRIRTSGRQATAEQIRADLKAIAPYTRAIRTLFLDRRRRAGAGASPPNSACRSRSAPGSTRTQKRNEREIALRDRSRPPQQQRQQRRGRQRNDLPRRADRPTN